MACDCYKVGGPWITFDPECPIHGHDAQAREKEAEQMRKELDAVKDDDADPYMGTFCERLRMAMRVSAVTNGELARRTGLSPDNVSHFARGERMPTVPNLAKLLKALPAVDARWLVTGVDP